MTTREGQGVADIDTIITEMKSEIRTGHEGV